VPLWGRGRKGKKEWMYPDFLIVPRKREKTSITLKPIYFIRRKKKGGKREEGREKITLFFVSSSGGGRLLP